MKVTARSIAPRPAWLGSCGEVVSVEYGAGRLCVRLSEIGGESAIEVRFAAVEAYRVMDERDLSEFWPECSSHNGWLFEVLGNGWLSQELCRPGSLVTHMNRGLREFLVAGVNDCVSVLSVVAPEVHILTGARET